MRGLFHKRGMLILAMSLWGMAALMQGLAPALSAFVPGGAESSEFASLSPVEAAVIHVGDSHGSPHRLAICPHHPQGCPAKCLCPKTGFVGDDAEVSTSPTNAGRLFEGVSWVECAEARSAVSPVFSIYLPEATENWIVTISSEIVRPDSPARPRAAALEPPAKIPIV